MRFYAVVEEQKYRKEFRRVGEGQLQHSLRSLLVTRPTLSVPLQCQFLMTVFICCFLMVTSGKRADVIDFSVKTKLSSLASPSVMAPRCWLQD